MVLDVTGFAFTHPGGRHVINHNLGRDISKFFYGGYTLATSSGEEPYKHSNIARETVNSMIIGCLHNPAISAICNIQDKFRINKTTSVFTLRTNDRS